METIRRVRTALIGAVALSASGFIILFYATWIWTTWTRLTGLPPGTSANMDFAAFWTAAKIALSSDWVAAFDRAAFEAARSPAPGVEGVQRWLYPPGFLAVIAPLGVLPFTWAWGVFVAVSLAVFIGALWPVLRPLGGWIAVALLSSPAVIVCVALGQTTLLFAGVLVLALQAIRSGQVWQAGLLCAVLTLKPQLGLALAVALMAGREWWVILWGIFFTVLMVAATLAYPGPEYWLALAAEMQQTADEFRQSNIVRIMITPFGSARVLGLNDAASILHAVTAICVLVGVAVLWSRRDVGFDWKAAALCLATPIVTPYALHYELGIVLVGAVFLLRAAGTAHPVWLAWAAVLWLLPVIGYYLLPVPGFAFTSLVLLVAFAHVAVAGLKPETARSA